MRQTFMMGYNQTCARTERGSMAHSPGALQNTPYIVPSFGDTDANLHPQADGLSFRVTQEDENATGQGGAPCFPAD